MSASPLEPVEASCTVTKYADVAAAVQSCSALILKDLTVPAKTTLALNLKSGATLTFQGTLKWEYAEWDGPLIEIKGSKVTVVGTGATLDGQGAKWWDGQGDKGKKKPKFF
ncbi:glycosyl hydrolase family 28 protein, partial [Nocardioides sp. SOB44]